MTPLDPKRISRAVAACRQAASRDDWQFIIEDICGTDDKLVQAVYEQLGDAANDATAAMPSAGESHDPSTETTPLGLEGSEVGPYVIMKKIGEGGYGVVYLAEQLRPIRRHVAVKVIKLGMDTAEVVRRFEAERQALALMNHFHVARIWGGGTTNDGRPYFAMEYVDGTRITRFCDQHRLTIRQRLELFLDVCDAVAHAHQRGIIHRDLKPSNVLVTVTDGVAVPKVIDFGVAKALDSNLLSDDSQYTAENQLVGTPMYMSPEQTRFSPFDVDVRCDVYSLGVIFYELLVSTTPHSRGILRKEGLDAMRDVIRDVDPPRPSSRLAQMSPDRRKSLAGRRSASIRDVAQPLQRELDWIAIQALARDRERRYQSVHLLSDDIRRFLAGKPIEACPPSLRYRARKLVERYAAWVTAIVLLLVTLVVATVVSTMSARSASRSRRAAERDNRRAQAATLQARKLLCAGDMQLAAFALQRNDVARMRELLLRHIPDGGEQDLRGFAWHFLWNQIRFQPQEILRAHGPLYYTCFSPDGRLLAASGHDATIRILDADSMALLSSIKSGQGEVNGLAFSPDSQQLASAGDDGSICLWEIASQRRICRIETMHRLVFQVAFTPSGRLIACCGIGKEVNFWNAETGEHVHAARLHDDDIECLAISRSGILFTGSTDETARLQRLAPTGDAQPRDYDPTRMTTLRHLANANQGEVSSVAFSHNNRVAVFGQRRGLLTVYDVRSEGVVYRHMFADGVQSIAVSDDRTNLQPALAVGDRNGNLHLLPIDWVQSARGMIATRGHSAKMRSWKAHDGEVYCIAFDASRNRLVSAGRDGRLRLWDLQPGTSGTTVLSRGLAFKCLGNNKIVVVSDGLPVLDSRNGDELYQLSDDNRQWIRVSVAGETGTVVAESSTGELFGWDRNGKSLGRLFTPLPGETVGHVSLSADGNWLAIVAHGSEQPSRLVLKRADDSVGEREIQRGVIGRAELSRSGKYLAYSELNTVRLVDTRSSQQLYEWTDQRAGIHGLQFAPSERYLASIAGDRSLRIHNMLDGTTVWSVLSHENSADTVAFSPDGNLLATAGRNGLLRVWRWRINRMVLEIPANSWPIHDVAFTPNGHAILSQEPDGITRYDATPAGNIDEATTIPDISRQDRHGTHRRDPPRR